VAGIGERSSGLPQHIILLHKAGRHRAVRRDFVLVGYDAAGRPAQLERYVLAPAEAEFWAQAWHLRTKDGLGGCSLASVPSLRRLDSARS
jgi:hypothetical protein